MAHEVEELRRPGRIALSLARLAAVVGLLGGVVLAIIAGAALAQAERTFGTARALGYETAVQLAAASAAFIGGGVLFAALAAIVELLQRIARAEGTNGRATAAD